MKNLILAYDLGTGGLKGSIFDESGESINECFVSYNTYFPKTGHNEQNPLDWWDAFVRSTKELLENKLAIIENIICIAVSGHSLGSIPIGKNGKLLIESVPIWSDTRASKQAQKFFDNISLEKWYEATGNGFPAHLYSIFKIMWYKDNMRSLYEETFKFIGTKDYINYQLTGKLFTDYSYASGSGVYDLKEQKYKQEFIENAGVSYDKLPDILSSTEIIGNILPETAKILGLKENVKVVCGGVDNSCMALGTGCVKDGMAYTSIGSSAWIAVSSHEPVLDFKYKPYVFAHCIPDMFVSSTSIFSAGTSFSWVKDTICKNLINEKEPYKIMDEMASKSEVGSKKLIFNPSLAGGSSIEKSPNIKGGFIGLNLGHTQNDLIRASMEGICLNLKMALEIMEQYVFISEDMLIAGGGSKSSFWRRLFADIYNKNILETSIGQNAAALGAAALGAVGMMIWPDFNKVNEVLTIKSITKPERENEKKYKIILGLFKKVAELQSDIGNIIEEITW